MLQHVAGCPSILKAESYFIICIYHIFFIHSSTDGCLACFHILVIVNSAARNIGMLISFKILISVLLDKYPAVGFLCHMVALFLTFLRNIYAVCHSISHFLKHLFYTSSLFSNSVSSPSSLSADDHVSYLIGKNESTSELTLTPTSSSPHILALALTHHDFPHVPIGELFVLPSRDIPSTNALDPISL